MISFRVAKYFEIFFVKTSNLVKVFIKQETSRESNPALPVFFDGLDDLGQRKSSK